MTREIENTVLQQADNQSEQSLSTANFDSLRLLMRQAILDGAFPGASLLVAKQGQIVFHEAFGLRSNIREVDQQGNPISQPNMTVDTVFDIAALTQLLVTSSLVMQLVDSNKITLDQRVSRYIQSFGVFGKGEITIRQLLSHTSGLPAWEPFFQELVLENSRGRIGILTSRAAKEYVYGRINKLELKYKPGSKRLYSDLGFIVLGQLIELLSGVALDKLAQRQIFQSLRLASTSFIDLSLIKRRGIHPVTELIAPTELCPWRKRILCGEVHDDNAWAMGGIAGHCGVFSTTRDLHRWAAALLRALHAEPVQEKDQFVTSSIVTQFFQQALTWEAKSKENGMLDSKLSSQARGLSGFTGCSIWIEPEPAIEIILLSNRINPSRNNKKLLSLRASIHDAILKALES